jgi:hypothetical protein
VVKARGSSTVVGSYRTHGARGHGVLHGWDPGQGMRIVGRRTYRGRQAACRFNPTCNIVSFCEACTLTQGNPFTSYIPTLSSDSALRALTSPLHPL